MKNIINIDGYNAHIAYDPDIEMFRGEFLDLNGGADFYAHSIEGLKREGSKSLQVFLEMCAEDGVPAIKSFSGKFNLRLTPELHRDISTRAQAEGKSLNAWVVEHLEQSL